MKELIITKHALDRGLERLMKVNTNEATQKQIDGMSVLLKSLIAPSGASFFDGSKYYAIVDCFEDYRAVIKVENGVHILTTITPIV